MPKAKPEKLACTKEVSVLTLETLSLSPSPSMDERSKWAITKVALIHDQRHHHSVQYQAARAKACNKGLISLYAVVDGFQATNLIFIKTFLHPPAVSIAAPK